MRVLVTGGAGYIGGISARYLLDAGHSVVVLDSLERGHAEAVDPRAYFVHASVADVGVLDDVLPDVDAVLHCAGYIEVAESAHKPDLYYKKNLAEAAQMLDRIIEHGVGLIVYSSTAAVYGQPDQVPITEDSPVAPINVYGASKLAFERLIEVSEHAEELRAVRLRYFNAAGAWPDGSMGESHDPESHIVPRVLHSAADGEAFTVYGDDYPTADGTCIRDYVHVMDLAEAHRLGLEYLVAGGAPLVCNLGSGRGYSNLEVVEACNEITGVQVRVEHGPRRDGDPAALVAAIETAADRLSWRPTRDLHEMVRDAWAWHSAHPEGYAKGS